jgi:hypothetical protein
MIRSGDKARLKWDPVILDGDDQALVEIIGIESDPSGRTIRVRLINDILCDVDDLDVLEPMQHPSRKRR